MGAFSLCRAGRRIAAGIAALAVAAASPAAFADVVHLKSGRSIEGTTAPGKKPGTLEVRTGAGVVVTVPEADILRVEKRRSPAEDVDERLRSVPPDLAALHELLAFARDKRLLKQSKAIAARILEIDPHDEAARKELGYVVYDNRWVLESELRKRPGLVFVEGEWMSLEEKARREKEAARKEVLDLLDLVESSNPYVQEFAIRKALSRRDEAAKEVFLAHISDPRKIRRMVAIRGLVRFPVKGPVGDAEKKAARELHRLALEEESPEVLKVLYATLGRFFPEESFRLALGTVQTSPSAAERRRAGEVLYHALRKSLVPELCRAASGPEGRGRPEVREALRRALGVDFGYDAAAWLRYWTAHEGEFSDD